MARRGYKNGTYEEQENVLFQAYTSVALLNNFFILVS
jgi:hypothetical protein